MEKNVVSISVKSAKTTCYTGDELELSVTVTYDDNSSEVITKGFTVAGFDNTAPGKQTVTVTYKEKTDSIEIEVIKKPEFDDFFAGIVNSVEVTNDATYPYVVDMTDSDGPLPALQQSGSRKYKQYIYDYAEGKGQCDA